MILIDSDVLIEHLRGTTAARNRLDALAGAPRNYALPWQHAKVRSRRRRPFSRSCVTIATALTEGLEPATLNVRHYPMFPGLARPLLI